MKRPQDILPMLALQWVGTHETSRNQGPGIPQFWERTNYPEGYAEREPWCAAFVSFIVAQAWDVAPALRVGKRPNFAAVSSWREWGEIVESGVSIFTPGAMEELPGDIVIYTFSHIGIVVQNAGLNTVTVEGNTDGEGHREGGRVMTKTRPHDSIGCFLRLPVKAER